MKTRVATWIAAFALAGVCSGQQSEEEKRFYADYAKSEQQAVALYPDAGNVSSAMSKRLAEIDQEWEKAKDPRYYSENKPMILCRLVANELGISPVVPEKPKASAILASDSETIPEMGGFNAVVVRKVEPDGLSVIHECGAGKIPIENLTADQRTKYGISAEGAAAYRRQVAANAAAYNTHQRQLAIQEQAEAETQAQASAEAEAAKQKESQANPPVIVQTPVWERFASNSVARAHNRNKVADEIRRQDGEAAAERFLAEQRIADAERNSSDEEQVAVIPNLNRISYLEGGKYQKRGNIIAAGGNFSSGYTIEGDSLTKNGSVTHKRSGSMWMPMKKGEKQIFDP